MEQRSQSSIRIKLTALVAAVVLLTALGLSLVSYVFARKTLRQQIHERLAVVTSGRKKLVLAFIHLQEERAGLVASRTRLGELLRELPTQEQASPHVRGELTRILDDALHGSSSVTAIWLTDPKGRVLAATDETYLKRDFEGTEELTEGLKKTPFLRLSRDSTGHDYALVAAPVKGDETPRGVVMLLIDAEPLKEALGDREGLGQTGEVLLGTRRDQMVHYFIRTDSGTNAFDLPVTRAPSMAEAAAGRSGFTETTDADGSQVLAAYAGVGYRDWGIVTKIDEDEAYIPIDWLRRNFIAVEGTIFIIGLIASYWLAVRFTKPILRMATMAESIAKGGLHAQVVVESRDEIGRLGEAFNKMSEELAHSYAILEDRVNQRTLELKSERDLLQGLLDNTPDRIYFKDAQSRFTRVNKAMAALFSLRDPIEAIGKTDFDFFSREHAQQAFEDELKIIRTGLPVTGLEEKETWADGHVSWASSTKVPLRDIGGNIIGTFGISRDITDRKRAEEELNRYFELSPDLFCIADLEGRFKRVSPSWTSTLGYTAAELLAKPFLDFVHPEDREATVAEYNRIQHGERGLQFENRYRCKDGSYRWLQWNSIPVPEQKIVHAVARDVSDHKRAQELLAKFADALNKKNQEMQEDLKLAREVHQIFVPKDYPSFPGDAPCDQSLLRFAHRYLPTSALGGDFFDIIPISDTQAGVLICDVMGHGMRAALVTSIIRGFVDKYHQTANDPGLLLSQINAALLTTLRTVSATIFATACYVVIDIEAGEARLANAGHPTPFLIRRSLGLVERLHAGQQATPLGLLPNTQYETVIFDLNPRDRMLLFTDGLFEVEAADGQQYGLDRLEEAVRRRIHSNGVQLLDELLLETRGYSANGEFTDDVCVVSVELAGRTTPPLKGEIPRDAQVVGA